MARNRKLVGIRRKRAGWQAYVDVVGRPQITKMFPIDEPIANMRAWREQQLELYGGASSGSFQADIDTYLAKPDVQAMSSYRERKAHLSLWAAALGRDRTRSSITQDEIEAVLVTWLRTLAQPTVYHRRTALQSLYVALDGPKAFNPVRHTTRPAPHQPTDRAVDFASLAKVVAAMPDERYIRKGIRQPSLAKISLRVLLATGLPHADQNKLAPRHLATLDDGRYVFPGRAKGQGTKDRTTELTADGVAALRAFHAANAYGRLPAVEAVGHAFKRAARRVLGPDTPVSPYWLRHSLGTEIYRLTGDTATVARILGHADGSPMTQRYTMGAHADVDRRALATLSLARAGQPVPHNLPANLPAPAKRLRAKHLRKVG